MPGESIPLCHCEATLGCRGNLSSYFYKKRIEFKTIASIFSTKTKEVNVMAKVELNVKAPDFTLDDFNGKSVSLSDYKNKKNVMVVFNRGFF